MKHFFTSLVLVLTLASCVKKQTENPIVFNNITIETLLKDSLLSIRAIDVLDKNSLSFAANKNTYGLYDAKTGKWLISKLNYDSLNLEFRAVANNNIDFFMLSVADPALLFKTGNSGKMELVYKEMHEQVFYDAMAFWNKNEGIAIGDQIDGCLSIIITRDGGATWHKIACENLPEALKNEGAFAASNTNIAIVENKTWVATTTGRVYFSPDKGNTWRVFNTPIVKAKDTEGIYSINFYDELQGFAIGGDYTKPDDSSANKIRTIDGGKTWELVAQNQSPGYRSCVQYVPNSNARALVAVGFKGIDFSNDGGTTWKHLSDEGFYTIRFLNDTVAYAAGNGRICRLRFVE